MDNKSPVKAPVLHSKYNPQMEASRYLDAVSIIKYPEFIVVTEPGESFLAGELRKRYPQAKICAVRYQNEFYRETDALWDFCWRPGTGIPLDTFLFNIIPDEYISLTSFLPWKPAEKFWPNEAKQVWQSIAENIHLLQNIINTRNAFGRRWLKNIIKNITEAENIAPFPEIKKPPLIIASGPMLENLSKDLKKYSQDFFICALSSASSFLTSQRITPDVVISTDGGYWAGRLFNLNGPAIPVAFPLEAYIPKKILAESPCVFLNYGSAIEKDLFSLFDINTEKADRNGTVAGTAVRLFLSKTKAKVYAAGLDLQTGAGFSHSRPHPFSPENTGLYFRLSPLELKTTEANSNSSLNVYRKWFENMKKENAHRLFRIRAEGTELTDLGGIKTITFRETGCACGKDIQMQNQRIPHFTVCTGKKIRLEKTAQWLFNTAEKIERDFPFEEFDSEKTTAEIIKLYSYKGYTSVLKSMGEGKGEELKKSLCMETSRFVKLLGENLIGNTKYL